MTTCVAGCGVQTIDRLCAFCRRTVGLLKARRCVSCKAPVFDQDTARTQGKCAECLGRNHRLSAPTRWILKRAAAARYVKRAA